MEKVRYYVAYVPQVKDDNNKDVAFIGNRMNIATKMIDVMTPNFITPSRIRQILEEEYYVEVKEIIAFSKIEAI